MRLQIPWAAKARDQLSDAVKDAGSEAAPVDGYRTPRLSELRDVAGGTPFTL